ncbi:protein of unknown function [Candidatus Methylomirabilis oxygeniifera]|uniref:Uncharacterized protein n=1 Tax=Methylomirabilis oxygeniifera TaxID=671143 RepID=D5MI44_METO1|nr:protein of unknown function [Candidatus Methylomirabilis oxyfera]
MLPSEPLQEAPRIKLFAHLTFSPSSESRYDLAESGANLPLGEHTHLSEPGATTNSATAGSLPLAEQPSEELAYAGAGGMR